MKATTTGSVSCGTVHVQVQLAVEQLTELENGRLECPVCGDCCTPGFRHHGLASELETKQLSDAGWFASVPA